MIDIVLSPDFLASAWPAIALTLQLASVTTLLLLVMGAPLAWWLARTPSRWREPVGALVTLPLVLPPSVLGFYLLLIFSPRYAFGQWLEQVVLPGIANAGVKP